MAMEQMRLQTEMFAKLMREQMEAAAERAREEAEERREQALEEAERREASDLSRKRVNAVRGGRALGRLCCRALEARR